MRLSCNGCRVLRKGCSEDCSIKPCLEWIKSPVAQANATVFLAKFYGRAGLLNLINAGPPNLRPAIFRSLLYEACARIVNPVYGSAGLLWSGSWQFCHNAVEAVLRAAPLTQMAADAAETNKGLPFKTYDIRHVNKQDDLSGSSGLHRVRNRRRFKRSAAKSKEDRVPVCSVEEVNRSPSHESSLSHQSEAAGRTLERESRECGSLGSAGKAEPALEEDYMGAETEVVLDLTLGMEPFKRCVQSRDLESMQAGGSAEDDT